MLRKLLLLAATTLTLGLPLACGSPDDPPAPPVAGPPTAEAAAPVPDALRCDAELRRFLTDDPHPVVTVAVAYVQSQHPDYCPTSHWDPHVSSISIDDAGNIDVSFDATGDRAQRWVFLFADDPWYSAEPNPAAPPVDQLAVLVPVPTVTIELPPTATPEPRRAA